MDIELWGLMPVTCYFSIIGFGSLNCQGTCICWTKEQNYYYYYFLKTKEVATWESEPCDFDDLHLQNCSRIWIFYDIHYIREPSQERITWTEYVMPSHSTKDDTTVQRESLPLFFLSFFFFVNHSMFKIYWFDPICICTVIICSFRGLIKKD